MRKCSKRAAFLDLLGLPESTLSFVLFAKGGMQTILNLYRFRTAIMALGYLPVRPSGIYPSQGFALSWIKFKEIR